MTLKQKLITAAAAAVIPLGGGALALPLSTAANAASAVTAVTSVTNRDDSGYATQADGTNNWAIDTFTRTASVTFVEETSGTVCQTLNPCYEFVGHISDNGTFAMDSGARSPNAGTTVSTAGGEPSGSMVGGVPDFTFYANSDNVSASGIAPAVSGDVPTTGNWLEGFFPANTAFVNPTGSTELIGTAWGWTYKDAKTCETWVDASNVTQANSGDITGFDQCVTSVTSPGNQTSTVGTPVSLQIAASTTSSDTALIYESSPLPVGLHLDMSTGLITGTPILAEGTLVVSVTAIDWGGRESTASFGWTVNSATPPTVLTGKYVCGRVASHIVWKISNVQGGVPAIANFLSKIGATRWKFDYSKTVPAHRSIRPVTTEGTVLKVYYDTNGSRPAPHEVGAVHIRLSVPAHRVRCG